jgi:hypothetical protein
MITSAEMESLERVRYGRARSGDRLVVVSLVDRLLNVLRDTERETMRQSVEWSADRKVLPPRGGNTLEKQGSNEGTTRALVIPPECSVGPSPGQVIPGELVLVESPFAGDVLRNKAYARAAMRECFRRGWYPFASHLLYTQPGVLDDNDPDERMLGIEAGLAWGAHATRSAVFTDLGVSKGMELGIERARSLGRAVDMISIRRGAP